MARIDIQSALGTAGFIFSITFLLAIVLM
jgi:hypothetical protein